MKQFRGYIAAFEGTDEPAYAEDAVGHDDGAPASRPKPGRGGLSVVDERPETVAVCAVERLTPGRGVAALLPDGRQVAVFRTESGEFHGLSNVDPFSRAAVLSRGIIGDAKGVEFVASPMLKQRFDLRTGVCLDDETVVLRTYQVRVIEGMVHICL